MVERASDGEDEAEATPPEPAAVGRAEGERAFLGLTHNPFAEPHRGFFDRGGRKTHLEQLRHLSEWSRRILLVTGPDGVGKTTLYRELAATLEPRVKAARINASLVNTGFEVLCAVAQGFGLGVPTDANTQSLRLDLIDHVQAQSDGDRLCLTLVDDAHLLDNKAVESLMALAHESALHLVLFGEVRMVPSIERAASAKGVGWQEIRLTGYGQADARDYLEWRFQQAKYRGRVPFTDNEVKDMVKLSEGLPGRIDQMANALLVKLESGEGVADRQGFPRIHAAVLALLVVLVGLLYLVFSETEPEPDLPVAIDQSIGDPVAGDDEPLPVEVAQAEVTDAEVTDSEVTDAELTDAEADLTGPVLESPEALDDGEAASSVSNPDTKVEVASPAVSDAAPVEPAEVPAAEESSDAGADAAADIMESGRAPDSDQSFSAESASPEPAPVEPTPTQRAPAGAKDTNWLLQQDASYYTLQLVTVSVQERAVAFVADQQEPGEFTIYQLQRDGRILHVVLYGLFSSRDAAQAAADNLPVDVGDVQPWIRQVGQVQAAARVASFQ